MFFSESPLEAWRARYGSEAPGDLPDLGRFLNHRSVRRFQKDPLPDSVLRGLIGAAQSASTSSNLQLWSVISVEDPSRREEIARLCADQQQVRDAGAFLAFIADTYRLATAARKAGIEPAGLDYVEFYTMAIVDAALAAERLVCAAESIGLGCCYIGALRNHPEGVAELLQLPSGTFGVFGLCVGVPAEDERGAIKPRLGQDQVWFKENYDVGVNADEYDERMRPTYAKRNLTTSWSEHSGTRADGQHMTGRETLLEFLQKQGLLKR